MAKVKIVVWDNIGNTILGMRDWSVWDAGTQERLLIEDPDARTKVVALHDLLSDHDIDLVWLYDPVKYLRGFKQLIDSYREYTVPITGPDVIARELADADFFVMHKEILPAEALANTNNLKLIQHLGQDYRGVPMAAATAKGIPVAATPLINYSAVAEHCWALILNHVKRLADQRVYVQSRDYLGKGGWGAYHPGVTVVSDLTLGLLGMGEIARPIARVAQAFNMKTIYWDIVRFPDLEAQFNMEFKEWDEIFAESDVLSVQLALNEKTEGIIGAREIGLMKPNALFMNTARGRLVDQVALTAALETGKIGGAALDVYYDEPLPANDPLHALHETDDHRVTLTPHSAAQGPWTWIRDSQELWFNVQRVLNGEEPHHLVKGSATV
jgi:D-3-phosphoglycerate dehydrogenase